MRFWRKLRIGSLAYDVVWATAKELMAANDGAECWGVTERAKARILVDRKAPPDHVIDTLVHEIMHVVWETSGVQAHLSSISSEQKADAAEEALIRMLTNTLVPALQDAGLCPTKVPRARRRKP